MKLNIKPCVEKLADARYDFAKCCGLIARLVTYEGFVSDKDYLESVAAELAVFAERSRKILEGIVKTDCPSDEQREESRRRSAAAFLRWQKMRINNLGKVKRGGGGAQ